MVVVRPWKLLSKTMISAASGGRPFTCRLDGGFDGFRAGVHGQRAVHARDAADVGQEGPQLGVVECARRERQPAGLFRQRGHELRMRMPKADGRVRRHHVEVAPAVGIEEPHAFAAFQHDRQGRVVACAVTVFQCIARMLHCGRHDGLLPGSVVHLRRIVRSDRLEIKSNVFRFSIQKFDELRRHVALAAALSA